MRKIYQSAPDVPQAIANRAIDIIERHFTMNGVRRSEELSEESRVRLMRELQGFFQSELPNLRGKDGSLEYDSGGIGKSMLGWFKRIFRWKSEETENDIQH